MIPQLNMSAGEFFELIRPSLILIAALLSIWVLASARKRFPLYIAFAWAAGTLFLPLVALPLYLCVILLWRRPVQSPRWPVTLPLTYGLIVTASIATYFYFDRQRADAHLARAAQARLTDDQETVIREYRRALELEDDPHTHKLLAMQLIQAGYVSDAISEFRLAEQGGEPDDLIHYYLGRLLEQLDLNGQAKLEFEDFLLSTTCTQSEPKCDEASERIRRMAR